MWRDDRVLLHLQVMKMKSFIDPTVVDVYIITATEKKLYCAEDQELY